MGKKKSLLITASLFGSVKWLKDCPPSWQEKAYDDLKGMLARDRPWEPSEEIKRGMDFEKTIQRIIEKANRDELNLSENFNKVLDEFSPKGRFQVVTKSFMDIADDNYCLYGKIDYIHREENVIKDIKATGSIPRKSFDDKFLNTLQHKIYCHNEKINNFRYVVAYFKDYKDDNNNKVVVKPIHEVIYVDYRVDDFEKQAEEIREAIGGLMQFFDQYPELKNLYLTTFSRY